MVVIVQCLHACMYTYIHTCMHVYMHACMHACIHTYVHTYIHTYIHTCFINFKHNKTFSKRRRPGCKSNQAFSYDMLCRQGLSKMSKIARALNTFLLEHYTCMYQEKKISSTATWTRSLRGGCTSILKEFSQGVKRCCHLIQSRQ